jgi:hypothetical protein
VRRGKRLWGRYTYFNNDKAFVKYFQMSSAEEINEIFEIT